MRTPEEFAARLSEAVAVVSMLCRSELLAPSSSSRAPIFEIMPRHTFGDWLSHPVWMCRFSARINAMLLGDRVRIDARRVGETNAAGTDQIGNVAVHAGADRLNELQPVGYREAALISAPQERRIAAAGLDVTRLEPLAGSVLWTMGSVLINAAYRG